MLVADSFALVPSIPCCHVGIFLAANFLHDVVCFTAWIDDRNGRC